MFNNAKTNVEMLGLFEKTEDICTNSAKMTLALQTPNIQYFIRKFILQA